MAVGFYGLTLGVLGVWRVTHLLHAEDGPRHVLSRIRVRLGSGLLGQAAGCFYCLSVWVAAPFTLLLGAFDGARALEMLLLWPALSAGAIVVERMTAHPEAPSITYQEDPEPAREER